MPPEGHIKSLVVSSWRHRFWSLKTTFHRSRINFQSRVIRLSSWFETQHHSTTMINFQSRIVKSSSWFEFQLSSSTLNLRFQDCHHDLRLNIFQHPSSTFNLRFQHHGPKMDFNINFHRSGLNIKSLVLRPIFDDFASQNSPPRYKWLCYYGNSGKKL